MDALEQLNLAAPITDIYTAIEQMIICRIAEQIAGDPQGLINNSSEWRIQMLARMGRLTKDTAKIIATQSKGVGNKIEAAIAASVQSVLKQNGLTLTDELSGNISSALSAYDRQAIRGKYNQVNTVMQYKAKQTALTAINNTASRFDRMMQKELDSKQEYLDVLNKDAMAVVLGERSRTEAIRATVEEMSAKGIPAFIDSSGREWSPEGYVNMDIRNTVKNAANAAQFACIEELGQDVVLVSSHAGARPRCAPYQGKFYSLSGKSGTIRDARGKEYTFEPWSSTSYGEAAGLLGINCGHSIRGVSDGMFINREKQYDEKENSEEYEKVVKQREIERKIRKQKTTRNALKAAGDDEGVREYERKIRETTAQLDAYCKKNGLTVRMDRTEVYGYSDPGRKKQHTDFVETIDISKNKDYNKNEPKRPENEPDNLKQFKRYDVSTRTDAEKLAQVNPNYVAGRDGEWENNCQRCVVAYELVERGYDVTAKARDVNDPVGSKMFKLIKNSSNSQYFNANHHGITREYYERDVEEAFKKWGNDARAVVSVGWKGGGGHVFIAKKVNGKIVYLDPQSNKLRDIQETLDMADDKVHNYLFRIDNAEFTDLIDYAVQNRR